MTICHDCAINKGLIPKDKVVGVWMAECPYCKEQKVVCDEMHDYKYPEQRPVTIQDVLLHQANNPDRK